MTMNETHYDAFISYRHTDLDMFVAKTLHKELEAFRLPKNLIKNPGPCGSPKTRIQRVFRDQDELPISSDLKDPIITALQNSDFLIVICTPRLKDSLWCRTEIEQFIAMHGREKVLAVLAEGEPQDSFPEQLTHVYENGQYIDIEPLAADVRGFSPQEIRRKIKAETLRLAAPMFGCGYDDLRQRHKERRTKRIVTAAATIAACSFAFGTVAATMALRIRHQSEQIAQQKDEIEEQYIQALKTNSKSQAAEALRILQSGDRLKAIGTVLDVFPDSPDSSVPYTPQAQYALSQCLGIYQDGSNVLPKHALHHDAAIRFMKLSPDSSRLMSVDQYGKLYLWDALEGTLLYESNDQSYLSEETTGFLDNNRIYFPMQVGIGIYDFSSGDLSYADLGSTYSNAVVSGDGKRLAVRNHDSITIYDANTLEVQSRCLYEGKMSQSPMLALDYSGTQAAFTWDTYSEDEGAITVLSLLTNGELTDIAYYASDGQTAVQLTLLYNNIYLGANTLDMDTMRQKGILYCFNIGFDAQLSWVYEGLELQSFLPYTDFYDSYLLINELDCIKLLSQTTGELLGECGYRETIVDMNPVTDRGYVGVRLQNGEYHMLTVPDLFDAKMEGDYTFETAPDYITDSLSGQEYMASCSDRSADIIIHNAAQGSRMERLLDIRDYYQDILADPEESLALLCQSGRLDAFNMDTHTIDWSYAPDAGDAILTAAFLKEDNRTIAVSLLDRIVLLDAGTGKVTKEITIAEPDLSSLKFSADGMRFALVMPWNISIYDTLTGKLLLQDKHPEELSSSGALGVSEDLNLYAAVCPEEQQVKVFQTGDSKELYSIPLSASSIQYVIPCAETGKLYLTYSDGRVEVYKEGSLIREYTDLPFSLQGVRSLSGGRTMLYGGRSACITDQDGEPVALLKGPCAEFTERKLYLGIGVDALLSFPVYDTGMLYEEGQAAISHSPHNKTM